MGGNKGETQNDGYRKKNGSESFTWHSSTFLPIHNVSYTGFIQLHREVRPHLLTTLLSLRRQLLTLSVLLGVLWLPSGPSGELGSFRAKSRSLQHGVMDEVFELEAVTLAWIVHGGGHETLTEQGARMGRAAVGAPLTVWVSRRSKCHKKTSGERSRRGRAGTLFPITSLGQQHAVPSQVTVLKL